MRRFVLVRTTLFSSIVLVMVGLVCSDGANGAWTLEKVGNSNPTMNASLAFFGNSPRIAYYAGQQVSSGFLKYAENNSGSWSIQTVDGPGWELGQINCLALDNNGYPAISYADQTNSAVKYAKWDGAAWATQTAVTDAAYLHSLQLYQGNPSFSYNNAGYSEMKYAAWNGTAWNTQTVDTAAAIYDNALAVDNNGKPWIAYTAGGNQLRCATWTGSAWSNLPVVDDINFVRSNISILTDPVTDYPRISYISSVGWDPFSLKYAAWNGSSWDIQTVDNSCYQGHGSFALDAAGRPMMSYYDYPGGVEFARWDGSQWLKETVAGDMVVWDTSLALDQDGNPHIAFTDRANGDLYYASTVLDNPNVPEPGTFIIWSLLGAAGIGMTWQRKRAG